MNTTPSVNMQQIIMAAQLKNEQEKNEQLIKKVQKVLQLTMDTDQRIIQNNFENTEAKSTSTCDTQSLLLLQQQNEIIKQQKEENKKLQQQIIEIKCEYVDNITLPPTSSTIMSSKSTTHQQRSPTSDSENEPIVAPTPKQQLNYNTELEKKI